MSNHPLDPLLRPSRIALLGASNRIGSPGHTLATQVIQSDFTGEVYPVNPGYSEVLGLACFANLEELPVKVEQVVIALANEHLEAALDAVIAHGAKAATIYSSAVLNEDQLDEDPSPTLQQRLKRRASEAGIVICGANGMGFYNLSNSLFTGIFPAAEEIETGGISYIAQSGSAFTTLTQSGYQLGFNLCVSCGNEITTTVADYMDWSLQQPETKVIALFLETVRDPQGFVGALQEARFKDIPVVALKVGKSPMAKAMALSHTGAIAGDNAAFEALFKRFNVIEVDDFDEMAAVLMLLQSERVSSNGQFAAMFESGGFRELISDLATELGLTFAPLSASTSEALIPHLDPGLKPENPLDAWGSPNQFEARFQQCLLLLMQDENVAGGAFIANFRDGYYLSEAIFRAVAAVSQQTQKPLALINCYSDLSNRDLCRRCYHAGIPMINSARQGLLAFKRIFHYHQNKTRKIEVDMGHNFEKSVIKHWRDYLNQYPLDALSEHDALRLVRAFSIPVCENLLVNNETDLLTAANQIGFPLAIKTAESGINHKTDIAGVFINVKNEAELNHRFQELRDRIGPSVLISQMVENGIEIALGVVNDPQFGPMIMVAAGGELIETLNDRAISLSPVNIEEAKIMLTSLKIYPLLFGVRGKPAANVDSLAEIIVKLSQLSLELRDQISEIDINPVIVNSRESMAVDALVLRRI